MLQFPHKHKLKILTTLVLGAFLLANHSVSKAQEQDPTALGVSPAIFELVLEPGGEKTTQIYVFNYTRVPLPIKAQVQNFIPSESIAELTAGERAIFDASEWFTVEPSDFILQPEREQEVTITIEAPEGTQPGGHYATVFFQPLLPADIISPESTYLTAKVGVLAFLLVKGDIVTEANITELSVKPFSGRGPVDFDVILKNTGNVHLLPSGIVRVKNVFGNEVGEFSIKPVIVLPHTERVLSAKWDKKFLWGRYTAEAEITYGSENKITVSGEQVFWVVPWLQILLTIIPLTLLSMTFIIFRRRILPALRILLGK
jgi:hypothetical protein